MAQLAVFLVIGCTDILNIVARLETRGAARPDPAAKIFFDEISSGAVAVLVVLLLWPLLRRLHRRRSGSAVWLGAVAMTGLFAGVLHVTVYRSLQVGLSSVVPALGEHHLFNAFAFEIVKDLAFFTLLSVALFGAPKAIRSAVFEPRRPAAPPAVLPPEDLLDLFDGRSRFRVRARDVVAVVSAGNYADVHLADGRKPLVRATLTSLEATLSAHGIIRVHRSVLVNPVHVTLIRTLPSGDRRLTIVGGRTLPVSRRHGACLEALLGAARPVGCSDRAIAA